MTTPTYFSVVTLQGQAKIAAALAGTAAVVIGQLAAGAGNGSPVTPVVTQTGLVHEIWRGDITSVARDPSYPSQVIVTATIPGSIGPATIRELALFASDGQCILVSNYPATDIAPASSGVITDITVQLVIVVDTAASVTVQVNSASLLPFSGMMRVPFFGADGVWNTPPSSPAASATGLVGTSPTGAFASLANQVVQWNGTVWLATTAPTGTIVALPDGSYVRWSGTAWSTWSATHTVPALVRLATTTETNTGTDDTTAVTPADLTSRLHARSFLADSPTTSIPNTGALTAIGSWANHTTQLGDSSFNATTGKFICGTADAGWWLFTGSITTGGSAYVEGLMLECNAVQRAYSSHDLTNLGGSGYAPNESDIGNCVSCLVYMNPGDWAQLYMHQSNSMPTGGGIYPALSTVADTYNTFSGIRVGL